MLGVLKEKHWMTLWGEAGQCGQGSVPANWCLLGSGSFLPRENGNKDPISLNGYLSERWLSGPWERPSWVAEDTSQRGRVRFYKCKFSKVNALWKRRLGTYNQILARRNSKFFWQHWAFSGSPFKGTGLVILGTQPWADRSYARVCSGVLVWVVDRVICTDSFAVLTSMIPTSWYSCLCVIASLWVQVKPISCF